MESLRSLSEWRTPFLDNLFLVLTELGAEAATIAVLCLIYWCINKRMAYGIGFSYFFSGVSVNTVKIAARVDRPWIMDPDFAPVEGSIGDATGYSFPSGHTQNATSLFGSLAIIVRKNWLRIILFLIVPVVAFSRMYLGVHTPADVLTGLGIGAVFAIVFGLIYLRTGFSDRFLTICSILLALYASASLAYAIVIQNQGITEYRYAADTSKMAGASIGFALGCWLECRYVRFRTGTAHVWQQAIKLIVGLAVTLLIKSGLKPLFAIIHSESLLFDALRYFITILWAVTLWPIIFNKLFRNPENSTEEPSAVCS